MKALVTGWVLFIAVVAQGRVAESLDVGLVWSGHPVGFALLTQGTRQYVAYYDEQRRMVVASREVGNAAWVKQVLPTSVGWDSHNYIAMAIDDQGLLHVAGNMHAVSLVYFREERAGDVTSLVKVDHMVGTEETNCTYPRFFRGPEREFVFTYRDGHSGDGNQIYNTWDGKSWRRLLDGPLLNGEGQRNAYMVGPQLGPDGWWHLVWVWREEPACETNHQLSYARSKDLVKWEKADGTPLPLPMTLINADVVDPVPVHGGIANGNTVIGFDSQNRVVLGYHKFDQRGFTQIYNARFENGQWTSVVASDWDYRWDFSGKGSIAFDVGLGPVHLEGGKLVQSWRNVKKGSGVWVLDEKTLKVIGSQRAKRGEDLGKVESTFPGMQVKSAGDSGSPSEKGVRYTLRWETLGVNRDHPREGELPAPSMLRVVRLEE